MNARPKAASDSPGAREMIDLAGRRVTALIAGSVIAGLAFSAVEIVFAGVLQAFLLHIGVLSPEAAALHPALARLGREATFAALITIGLARATMVALNVYLPGAACEELKRRLRGLIVERMFRARFVSGADAMSHFTARVDAFGAAASAAQSAAAGAATGLLLFAALIAIAPKLTLGAVAILALSALPLRGIDRFARHSADTLSAEWRSLTGQLLASVRNLLLLQLLGTRDLERRRAVSTLDEYRRHILVYYAVSAVKVLAPQTTGLILISLIAFFSQRWGVLSPGALLSYFYLFLRLVQMLTTISQSTATFVNTAPQIGDLVAWLREDYDRIPDSAPGAKPERVGFMARAAAFSYPGSAVSTLAGIDLRVDPGETLVISGPSGSGKSTLLSLLLGLTKPDAGVVLANLDGREVPASEARGRVLPATGYVGPESFVVEGSLLDNLRYGLNREPSDEELRAALAAADCDFIGSSRDQLLRPLTEQGQGLSAGQKQRLALARALLRQPSVLVLDEATSNLDSATEGRIIMALRRLKGRITIIAVSHRPALLDLADRRLDLVAQGLPSERA